MASIWKHPDSPYFTACYTNAAGTQVKRSTKLKDRNKAYQVALEWERVEQQARAGTLSTAQIQKVFNEVVEKTNGDSILTPSVEKYLNEWLLGKEVKNKPGTVERYSNTVRLFLKFLGEKAKSPLTTITSSHIENFLNHRLANGAAPKTAIVDIKTLSTAFNRADRKGIILKNPVLAVELPKDQSSVREVFTHEQVGKMLESVSNQDDWFTMILLGYCTGARLSDCAKMKWRNFDFRKGILIYQQQKTQKVITVPIHRDLMEQLSFLSEFAESEDGFVCPDLAERTSGGKHGLSESFNRLVKKAGIDPQEGQGMGSRKFRKLTFHSLRHSFNSALAEAGIHQEIRMKLTGHSSVGMNSRYTHGMVKPLQNAIDSLPNFSPEDEDER
jgi:integrase